MTRSCRFTDDFRAAFNQVNTVCCAQQAGGARGASCRSGIPFECDVACAEELLPFMEDCFRHAGNMDNIHRDLYSSLQMECELIAFAPHVSNIEETGHRHNPKTEALLPVVPCDRATLSDRLVEISAQCCIRGALDCQGVVPDTCSLECAAVFLPFWAQCATDFADYFFGAVDVSLLNTFAGSCADLHGSSLHGSVGSSIGGNMYEGAVVQQRQCQPSVVLSQCSRPIPAEDACETPCMQTLVHQFDDCAAHSDLAPMLHPLRGAVDVCRTVVAISTDHSTPPPPPPPVRPACPDDPNGVIASQGYSCDVLVDSLAVFGGCDFLLSPEHGTVAHQCPARCHQPCGGH